MGTDERIERVSGRATRWYGCASLRPRPRVGARTPVQAGDGLRAYEPEMSKNRGEIAAGLGHSRRAGASASGRDQYR